MSIPGCQIQPFVTFKHPPYGTYTAAQTDQLRWTACKVQVLLERGILEDERIRNQVIKLTKRSLIQFDISP